MIKEDKHAIQTLQRIADTDMHCRNHRGLLPPAIFSHLRAYLT